MKTTVQIIDEIRSSYNCRSDAEIARKLGLSRSAISAMRRIGTVFEEETAMRAADLLKIPHEQILLWMSVERARKPEARRAWENIAKALSSTAAALLFFIMPLTAPQPVQAAIEIPPSLTPVYYVKRRLRRLSLALVRFCSTFWPMDFATTRNVVAALALSATLTACGSEHSSNDEPAPPAGPCETFGRVCVYHDADAITAPLFVYDIWYRLGAECVAASLGRTVEELPVAVIRVTADRINIGGEKVYGRFSANSGQITVVQNDFNTVAHEAVHHSLYFFSQDFSHRNPAFGTCVPYQR